jgi:hypothetical protein
LNCFPVCFPVAAGRVSLFGWNSLRARSAENAVCQRFSFPAALDGFAARADRLLSHFKNTDEICFR